MPIKTHHITEAVVAGEVGSFTYDVTMTLGAGALAQSARGWLRNYSSRCANRCSYCSSARACCRSFECAGILRNCRTADPRRARAGKDARALRLAVVAVVFVIERLGQRGRVVNPQRRISHHQRLTLGVLQHWRGESARQERNELDGEAARR